MKARSRFEQLQRLGINLRERYLLSLLAFLASAFLLLFYFGLGINRADGIWSNIIAGAVDALWLFIILRYVFVVWGISLPGMEGPNQTGALIEFYTKHEDVAWAEIIASANQLVIIVHYYDRWVRENYNEFSKFFGRGGTLHLIMADPEDEQTLKAVHTQFFTRLTQQRLKEKIIATEEELAGAFVDGGSRKAGFVTHYFPQALHFAAVIVNERHVYLSAYEQFRGKVIRSSVFHLDLFKDTELQEYWKNNVSEFVKGSRIGSQLPGA